MREENNYYIWDKGEETPLSPHFSTKEMNCRCDFPSCQEQRISITLINQLEQVRNAVGPITITSAYRCPEKQQQLRDSGIETAVGKSSHELGNAVDMKCGKMWRLEEECDKVFKAMGVANSFIHVDTRDEKIRRWRYK